MKYLLINANNGFCKIAFKWHYGCFTSIGINPYAGKTSVVGCHKAFLFLPVIRIIVTITFVTTLLGGCQSSTTSSETEAVVARAQQIYSETMTLHDEVMPRMGELVQLRQELGATADSLREADSVAYADTVAQMQAAAQDLAQADENMMQWMRSVEKVPGADSLAAVPADTARLIQVQQEQKAAMEQVQQQMDKSIAEARRLLGREG